LEVAIAQFTIDEWSQRLLLAKIARPRLLLPHSPGERCFRLLNRNPHLRSRDPGSGDLNRRHSCRPVGRPDIDPARVHHSGPPDAADHFRRLPIYRYGTARERQKLLPAANPRPPHFLSTLASMVLVYGRPETVPSIAPVSVNIAGALDELRNTGVIVAA